MAKKNKTKIFCTLLLIINILFLAFNIGIFYHNTSYSEITTSEDKQDVFGVYYGNWFDSNEDLISYLNNNPIDEKYYRELEKAIGTYEETKIIEEWCEAYECEIKNLRQIIEEYLSSTNSQESLNALETFQEISQATNIIFEHNTSFIIDYKMSTTGYGTIIPSFSSFEKLRNLRIYAFELAELVSICIDEEFSFSQGEESIR